MSERVKRENLIVGRWYVVRQGSVNRPMSLVAWCSPGTVIMQPRTGTEREVSILKIVEGWDATTNQRELLPKAGDQAIPGIVCRTRAGDPGTSVAAAKVAQRTCGKTAYRILAAMDGQKPVTDEQIAKLLPRIKSPSSIRGRRSDLVHLGYAKRFDCAGRTSGGHSCTRWTITGDGLRALDKFLEGAK